MWTRPRETVRQQIDRLPSHGELVPVVIVGALHGVGSGFREPLHLAVALAAGPVVMLVTLYVGSWVLRWIGSLLGGQGSYAEVRTAFGWAHVPTVWTATATILLTVVIGLAVGDDVFAIPEVDPDQFALPMYQPSFALWISLVLAPVGIWSLVIACRSLGEAHGFSGWAGFGTFVLSFILVTLFYVVAAFVLGGILFASL